MSYDGKPTQSQIEGLEELKQQITNIETDLSILYDKQISNLNNKLKKSGVSPILTTDRETFFKK